jgi:metallo-beta-lactamase family protein
VTSPDKDAQYENKWRKKIHEMPHLQNLKLTATPQESMGINRIKSGAIVISASGMLTGGRIIHHLKHNISRNGSHVMIVGYQANGTLGWALVEGKHKVRIHGDEYQVKAKVHTVGGLSAHGDVDDLSRWLGSFHNSSPHIHVVHGEPDSKSNLCDHIESALWLKASVPDMGDILEI